MEKTLTINGKKVSFDKEKNLLEVIRKANIELPTFCYHSELSTYGACRLCLVNVEKRGLVPACSTPAEDGMVVVTNSNEIRELRKIIVELLLANHDRECTSCHKSESCQLQTLARRLGIQSIRYKKIVKDTPKDFSTPSLVRDPNKCVLCGDCVRFCEEIQTVGAIDFSFRGSHATVSPSFGKSLASSECIYCGQCTRVCPTGALTIKSDVTRVWNALGNKDKKVIVAIAPAVRAAIGEAFGIAKESGTEAAGKMVTALKNMGFFKVFDISFAADLTIVEEANEFVERFTKGEKLPQFTSCCPAWIKFTEQYYPDMIKNLSSCMSPQGMFGSLAKEMLPKMYGIKREDLVVVSVMPCTAKKFEATRPELSKDGIPDTDIVLTTQELARMIEESGLSFANLEQSAFDMPLGFKTGGGVIFGNSGGVAEAVLRNVLSKENSNDTDEFAFIRGEEGIREANLKVGDKDLRLAVVYGLGNARKVIKQIKNKEKEYDLIEVMACPGGCIGGAGQPVYDKLEVRNKRTKCLYENDSVLELHKPQDNPYVQQVYKEILGAVGGEKAHEILHTFHTNRRRITEKPFLIQAATDANSINVNVCFGTGCMLRGSQKILKSILDFVESKKISDKVEVKASFCFERCSRGPVVSVGSTVIEQATPEKVAKEIEKNLK
ncbi:[FeFe] hydrogenase, group A [Candidatus Ruminimicrobiellum ovillum]|uniref:[FeFe] hydrogenase, group A n=1 Tax=Candidatus Ruminimicrobiellum ovillum TaxID=1947927 RepID=UPI00355AC6B6